MNFKSLVFAGAMAISAAAAQASTIASVGTSVGSTDFVSSEGGALVSVLHPSYLPNSATSEWVWDQNLSATPVTFSFTFDLTGYDVASASLSGLWGVDNFGTAYLNGTAISTISFGYAAFQSLTAYGANAGFVAGQNVLSFVVQNTGPYNPRSNPAAFRAEVTVDASPVPLPAGGLLLISGLGMLTFGRKKKVA